MSVPAEEGGARRASCSTIAAMCSWVLSRATFGEVGEQIIVDRVVDARRGDLVRHCRRNPETDELPLAILALSRSVRSARISGVIGIRNAPRTLVESVRPRIGTRLTLGENGANQTHHGIVPIGEAGHLLGRVLPARHRRWPFVQDRAVGSECDNVPVRLALEPTTDKLRGFGLSQTDSTNQTVTACSTGSGPKDASAARARATSMTSAAASSAPTGPPCFQM